MVVRSFQYLKIFQLLISDCGLSKNLFTSATSFHVPKYTQFTVFSTHLLLNRHYNRLLTGSISGFKILMINCIDKNKKVNINFNSWKKFPLDNRQPSKALKFNSQPSKSAKFNRQPSKLHPHCDPLKWPGMLVEKL